MTFFILTKRRRRRRRKKERKKCSCIFHQFEKIDGKNRRKYRVCVHFSYHLRAYTTFSTWQIFKQHFQISNYSISEEKQVIYKCSVAKFNRLIEKNQEKVLCKMLFGVFKSQTNWWGSFNRVNQIENKIWCICWTCLAFFAQFDQRKAEKINDDDNNNIKCPVDSI